MPRVPISVEAKQIQVAATRNAAAIVSPSPIAIRSLPGFRR
jgi:hypothetical protein